MANSAKKCVCRNYYGKLYGDKKEKGSISMEY